MGLINTGTTVGSLPLNALPINPKQIQQIESIERHKVINTSWRDKGSAFQESIRLKCEPELEIRKRIAANVTKILNDES